MGKEVNHGLDVRLKKISYLCLVDRIYRGGEKKVEKLLFQEFFRVLFQECGKIDLSSPPF